MADDSIVDLIKQHEKNSGGSGAGQQDTDNANAEMVRRAEAMSQNIPVDHAMEGALENLLKNVKSKMAWTEIELPSQGLLYADSVKRVEIRPFTFDDERLLKNIAVSKKDPDQVIDTLLRNCVKGIDINELLPHDRLYILFRLRGISYGDEYPISHDCTKCEVTSKLDLTISTLVTTSLTKDHMIFTLPDSENEVEIKLPRQQDNHLFNNADSLMENLHLFIHRIGTITDNTILEAFIRRTTVRDIDTLRSRIFTPDYGMETHFFYNCAGCGTKNKVEIELNESFFTAS